MVACGGPTSGDPGYVLVTADAGAGGVELLVEGDPKRGRWGDRFSKLDPADSE